MRVPIERVLEGILQSKLSSAHGSKERLILLTGFRTLLLFINRRKPCRAILAILAHPAVVIADLAQQNRM